MTFSTDIEQTVNHTMFDGVEVSIGFLVGKRSLMNPCEHIHPFLIFY